MATPSSLRRIRPSILEHLPSPRALLRPYSTGPYSSSSSSETPEPTHRPRWQSTPKGMSMPIRIRHRDMSAPWICNSSPQVLSVFYTRFLGADVLEEETRWLAVTHKSFDQGKRGFNDRLSYLGRRIVELQASLAMVGMPLDPVKAQHQGADEYGRYPFEHHSLEGLENLSESQKLGMLSKGRLAQLGREYGLDKVLRWVPKKVDNLTASGVELVMAQAMYAIIGAVALERGGQVANQVTREKILMPLGLVMGERL